MPLLRPDDARARSVLDITPSASVIMGISNLNNNGHNNRKQIVCTLIPWILALLGLFYGVFSNSPDIFRSSSAPSGKPDSIYSPNKHGSRIRGHEDETVHVIKTIAEHDPDSSPTILLTSPQTSSSSTTVTTHKSPVKPKKVKKIVIEEYDDDDDEYDDDESTKKEENDEGDDDNQGKTGTSTTSTTGSTTTTTNPPVTTDPPSTTNPIETDDPDTTSSTTVSTTVDDIPQFPTAKVPNLNCKRCFRFGKAMSERRCLPALCPVFPTTKRNVISTSLYGDSMRYTGGSIRNAEIASVIFPGWQLRYYMKKDGGTPSHVIDDMKALGADIQYISENDVGFGMNWRFLVADDPNVDAFICRDADSRVSLRDRYAVDEWMTSEKAFHIVRDHPSHASLQIMGGTWGARRHIFNTIGSLRTLLTSYISRTNDGNGYMADINFLQTELWSRMVSNGLTQHDSYSCAPHRHGNIPGLPFPRPRAGVEHVGAVYLFENTGLEQPRQGDLDILIRERPPAECQPTTTVIGEKRAEWSYNDAVASSKVVPWNELVTCKTDPLSSPYIPGGAYKPCSSAWKQTHSVCTYRKTTNDNNKACSPQLLRWENSWIDHLKENSGNIYTAVFDYDHHIILGAPENRAGVSIPQYHERMPYEQEPIQALDGGVRYYSSLIVAEALYGVRRITATDTEKLTHFALQDIPRILQITPSESILLLPPAISSALTQIYSTAVTNYKITEEIVEQIKTHLVNHESYPSLYYSNEVYVHSCLC